LKDEKKYQVVDQLVNEVKKIQNMKTKTDRQEITEIPRVNGIRFSFGMDLGVLLDLHQINHR